MADPYYRPKFEPARPSRYGELMREADRILERAGHDKVTGAARAGRCRLEQTPRAPATQHHSRNPGDEHSEKA